MEEEILDITPASICRCCLGEHSALKTLYCKDIINSTIMSFRTVFGSVFGIELKSDDGFPQKICPPCRQTTIDFYVFQHKCKSNQLVLRSVLDNRLTDDVVPEVASSSAQPNRPPTPIERPMPIDYNPVVVLERIDLTDEQQVQETITKLEPIDGGEMMDIVVDSPFHFVQLVDNFQCEFDQLPSTDASASASVDDALTNERIHEIASQQLNALRARPRKRHREPSGDEHSIEADESVDMNVEPAHPEPARDPEPIVATQSITLSDDNTAASSESEADDDGDSDFEPPANTAADDDDDDDEDDVNMELEATSETSNTATADQQPLAYTFAPGARLNSNLLYTTEEMHLYRKSQSRPTYDRYICNMTRCLVSLKLTKPGKEAFRIGTRQHEHLNQQAKFQKDQILNKLKKDATRSMIDMKLDKLYPEHVDIDPIRSGISENQIKNMLKSFFKNTPRTLAAIKTEFERPETMRQFGHSLDETPTVFYRGTVSDPVSGFTVFASEAVLRAIAKRPDRQQYHIDGTMEVIPKTDYRQMLVWEWMDGKKSVPFIFALLTVCTSEAYANLCTYIEQKLGPLKVASVVCEYDDALYSALGRVFGCPIRGSYFFYTQAVRRESSQLKNFFSKINSNSAMSQVYHKFLALPFLPRDRLLDGYHLLEQEAWAFGDSFNEFLLYFHKEWFQKWGGPDVISVHGIDAGIDNMIEAHHVHLSRMWGSSIYRFVINLRKEMHRQEIEFFNPIKNKSKVIQPLEKCKKRSGAIQSQLEQIGESPMSVGNFLSAVASRKDTFIEQACFLGNRTKDLPRDVPGLAAGKKKSMNEAAAPVLTVGRAKKKSINDVELI